MIDQFADHYHWDNGKDWTESRNAEAGADALGGGHAHSGMMIYQGDNWPEQYRGHLFTVNFHGRRINEDRLEQNGSGLVGRHEPDFIKFDDPWFRGNPPPPLYSIRTLGLAPASNNNFSTSGCLIARYGTASPQQSASSGSAPCRRT